MIIPRKKLSYLVAAASALATLQSQAQLEEVVVTAQKRSESIQEVPIAVSAFSSDEIRALDARDFKPIVLQTPGLSGSSDAATQTVLTIRGIGTGAFSPGADNSVGTYFNEIPVSRNIGGMGYLDVASIEVVKGPQGTLFGRNTSSGAISVTNQFAQLGETNGSIRLGVGDEGQFIAEGVYNAALSESAAIRIAARHDERDGTFANSTTGDELNGRDHDQFRIGFTANVGEALTVNAYWDHFEMENRWQMVDNFGLWGNDLFGDEIAVNGQPSQTIDADLAVLKLTWELENGMSLTSNTGLYNSSIVALPTDADTGEFPIVDFIEPWDLEQVTQEFRLNGSSDRIDWFVGVSFYEETAEATSRLTIYEDPGLDVLFEDEGLCGVAADFGLSCGTHIESSTAVNDTTSMAIYGDMKIAVTDLLTLTLGGRYTDEEKEMVLNTPLTDSTTTALISVVTGAANNAVFSFTPGAIREKQSWSSFDPRIALDYKISDSGLLYVNYAEGFKSGGFNRQPTVAGGTAILAFDPEGNDALEAGFKVDMANDRLRLNVAAFSYDYTDYQLETNDNASILIQNVADLDTSGVEIDATWVVSDALEIRGSYASLDAEFQRGVIMDDAGGSLDLSGKKAIRAPDTTYSLSMSWNISDALSARADYAYVDEMFYTADNSDDLKADSYSLLNVRADYNINDSLSVSVVGDNLTDEEYVSSMINFLLPMSLPGYGRTVRAEVQYAF